MATLWTTPLEWQTKYAITKERLNAISDNLTYLHQPSADIKVVRGTSSDVVISGTTPTAIDDALFTATLETTGRLLTINLIMTIANGTSGVYNYVDVLMDGTTYISSLSGTNLSYGLLRDRQTNVGYDHAIALTIPVAAGDIAAGVHTFVPRLWVSAGSCSVRLSSGYYANFGVRE